MNLLLFILALVGWSVAIIACIAFSIVSVALVSTQSEMFEDLDADFEKFLRDQKGSE